MRLYSLPQVDNTTFKKAIDIEEDKLTAVDETFYSSTIFNSQKDFERTVFRYEKYIIGKIRKDLVETPLLPERGNGRKTFLAKPNKGVSWGLRLNDYRNNRPLLTIVVDKAGSKYSYSSVLYNFQTNQFEDSITASKNIKDTSELLDFVVENLETDISKFKAVSAK